MGDTPEQIKERVARKSLPGLDRTADELEALTQEIFAKRVPYEPKNGADQMVLAFVTKQREHLRSVRTLIAAGAHRDALLVARTMLEGLGRLRWAFAEIPMRTDRWLWFGAILDWRQTLQNEQQGIAVDPDEKEELQCLVAEHGPNYLSSGVVKAMKQAEERGEDYDVPDDPWDRDWTWVDVRSMFVKVGMEQLYDGFYRSTSEWTHWGPRAIFRAKESTSWGTAEFTETDWPGAARALAFACVSLLLSLETLNNHFSLGHGDRLTALYETMKRDLSQATGVGLAD